MDSNIGKKLDQRYELLELIGVGGMADIYKAKDVVEDRIVAVKILKNEFLGSEDFLRRFRNESKAIALLSHPNIVKIFDVGFSEKIQFIVMEYIDGITLTEYIERQGVLKWRDAVHFTIQILKALQHAHDRGIVHRDIKSQNIMLLPDGTIKVMDFGIARFNRETDKTISEKAIGSVHYISPEQARGETTDEKSDIYSVGVMLYEMLSGQKPFDGDNPVSIALMHMQTMPKKLSEINNSIPEGLQEITMKAMQKVPQKRYQTAGEMIKDIEEFKKNPSTVFEYKYFAEDGTAKYSDDKALPIKKSVNKRKDAVTINTDDDDDDDDDDIEDEVAERRSPLLPILFAVASVFVIMTAWLIYQIVTQNIFGFVDGGGAEIKMPRLIGKTWQQVTTDYADLNLNAESQYSIDYEKYMVMTQSVPEGRTIKENQQINVTVSLGPKLFEIEDFKNRHVDEAKLMLNKREIDYVLKYEESEEIPADYVIKTVPAAHTMIKEGEKVVVYVSTGATEKLTSVPDLLGIKLQTAMNTAKQYNIILIAVYEPSSTVEEGRIIRQSIDPMTQVERDTEIEVTVSNGEKPSLKSSIAMKLSDSASGTFTFEYYINGTLQEELTEIKDIGLSKQISWEIEGNDVRTYAIKVSYAETGKSGILVEMEIDFTGEEAKKKEKQFNPKVFRELKIPNETLAPETTIADVTTAEEVPAITSISLDGFEEVTSNETLPFEW